MPFTRNGIWMGDLQGQTTYANSAFCELVGYEFEEIAGTSCFEFVFPKDLQTAKLLLEENKKPNAKPFLFTMRRKDGSPVTVQVQGTTLKTAEGRVYGILATVTRVPG